MRASLIKIKFGISISPFFLLILIGNKIFYSFEARTPFPELRAGGLVQTHNNRVAQNQENNIHMYICTYNLLKITKTSGVYLNEQ